MVMERGPDIFEAGGFESLRPTWERRIRKLFLRIKQGGRLPFDAPPEQQFVKLHPEALSIAAGTGFPGLDPAAFLSGMPDGDWVWVGPLDERAAMDGDLRDADPNDLRAAEPRIREIRRRNPGLARTELISRDRAPLPRPLPKAGRARIKRRRRLVDSLDQKRRTVPHIFSGDGVITRVRFGGTDEHGRPIIRFRRQRVVTERIALEHDKRRSEEGERWLDLQEATRLEAATSDTEAGMRESANTAVFPLSGMWLVCYEAGRPYLLSASNLETIGAVGRLSNLYDVEAPWPRCFAMGPRMGRTIPGTGTLFPYVPTTAHPGIEPSGRAVFFPYFRYESMDADAEVVDGEWINKHPEGPSVHKSELHTVRWTLPQSRPRRPSGMKMLLRQRLRRRRLARGGRGADKPGIRWGAHQSTLTEHWFCVVDSGFVTEGYQFSRSPDERGYPPVKTDLWFHRREGFSTPGPLRAYRVRLDRLIDAEAPESVVCPTVHAYADWKDGNEGRKVTMWLLGNRYFDSSEWIRGRGELVRHPTQPGDSLRAPWETWGFPITDQAPESYGPVKQAERSEALEKCPPGIRGLGKKIYRVEVDPITGNGSARTIWAPRGTILAAEPKLGINAQIPELWWASQGVWPELDSVKVARRWLTQVDNNLAERDSPLERQHACIFRTTRDGAVIDSVYVFEDPTWIYGLCMVPEDDRQDDPGFYRTPDSGFLLAAGVRADRRLGPVEELYVFDIRGARSDGAEVESAKKGPAVVIRAKEFGRGLDLGFGIHGHWMAR